MTLPHINIPHPKLTLEGLKNISLFALVMFLITIISYGAILGYSEYKENRRERKLILEGIAKVNKKIILQQVVSEKMPDTPVETVVSISDKLYERTQIYNMDLAMICGMIDVESKWNLYAISPVRARGLLQVMPSTARPYLAANQVPYSDQILFNPVINITVGLAKLFDDHQQYIELGVEKENEYMFSLNTYFWGQGNVCSLLGTKDARITGPNFAYYKRVMDASKYYRDRGL